MLSGSSFVKGQCDTGMLLLPFASKVSYKLIYCSRKLFHFVSTLGPYSSLIIILGQFFYTTDSEIKTKRIGSTSQSSVKNKDHRDEKYLGNDWPSCKVIMIILRFSSQLLSQSLELSLFMIIFKYLRFVHLV